MPEDQKQEQNQEQSQQTDQNPRFNQKPDPRLRKPGKRRTQHQENRSASALKNKSNLVKYLLPVGSIGGSIAAAVLGLG